MWQVSTPDITSILLFSFVFGKKVKGGNNAHI
jgi:hypothetical protein